MDDELNYRVHIVSGKTVDVRMEVFLGQVIPAIYDEVQTEHDRMLALDRVYRANAKLLKVAIERHVPENALILYSKKVDTACSKILEKVIHND